MQRNERQHQTLQVLNEVVEDAQALGVFAGLHVQQAADLGGLKADVLVPQHNLQLLTPYAVSLRPVRVVFLEDLGTPSGGVGGGGGVSEARHTPWTPPTVRGAAGLVPTRTSLLWMMRFTSASTSGPTYTSFLIMLSCL
jgi:hypothetical protein